ncbi:hypothetical protein FZEAL_5018 [Fusarium zealandicum]|uniref:Uncharacterized protein n=1 Tax=Fusarium zealandicum TaxID=1053134 RepID=A0A8H4UKJ3_9HYPO|nr:hypothetical protein FZEAL_5018 [Fusarium zealandicum]
MARKKTLPTQRNSRRRVPIPRKPKLRVPRFLHLDHAGHDYAVVNDSSSPYNSIIKLGIQIYCLGSPKAGPEELRYSFLNSETIGDWGDASHYRPHVDVYTEFGTVEACIEHHHREKVFRKEAVRQMRQDAVKGLSEEKAAEKLITEIGGKEPLPHIVPYWCPSEKFWREGYYEERYRSWILVIPEDRSSWEEVEERGLLQVKFDLDVTPMMETEMEDNYEECGLATEKDGWVYVGRSGYEKCKPVDCILLCARKEPKDHHVDPSLSPRSFAKAHVSWHTLGSERRFFDAWSDATQSLRPDCVYRRQACYECDHDEPHDRCADELYEHYYDHDGQCIACRRANEYRRRSKRIAARGQKRPHESR